jgi:hypothetical protein
MMSPEMAKLARQYEEEDARALVEEEEFRNTMPPHEYLSRQSEFSPMISCSLFEGVGRTLKGRDLRQVRNAVLSQTGFFDSKNSIIYIFFFIVYSIFFVNFVLNL